MTRGRKVSLYNNELTTDSWQRHRDCLFFFNEGGRGVYPHLQMFWGLCKYKRHLPRYVFSVGGNTSLHSTLFFDYFLLSEFSWNTVKGRKLTRVSSVFRDTCSSFPPFSSSSLVFYLHRYASFSDFAPPYICRLARWHNPVPHSLNAGRLSSPLILTHVQLVYAHIWTLHRILPAVQPNCKGHEDVVHIFYVISLILSTYLILRDHVNVQYI